MSHRSSIITAALVLSLAGAMQACDKSPEGSSPRTADGAKPRNADNTGRNEADRKTGAPTAGDQGGSESDRTITAEIRKAILAEKGLSVNAQNCKIITQNGVVTLRGPVETEAERSLIADKAKAQAGVTSVVNDLEVKAK